MELLSTLATFSKPIIAKSANIAWENRNHVNLFLQTKFGKFKDKDIRFSISGLFKIKIPNSNKFLLVTNRRIKDQLQPVGGVYKRYGDDSLFNKWGFKPDNSKNGLDVDVQSSNDMRFMVKGKFSVDVMNWFEKGAERELDPRREFREELLDTGILDSSTFNHIDIKHIRRFSKNLQWSDYFSCYEVLIYDVFELIPTKDQELALTDLAHRTEALSKGYAIASCDEIEQLRFVKDNKQIARIGQHTKLLINKEF